MAPEHHDALRRMEERLAAASDVAERLIAEAAGRGRRDRPPQAGWQAPPDSGRPASRGGELELLLAGARLLELLPAEVRKRLIAALRELLLAMRALIDFYVERLERPQPEVPRVRDIPIE